MYYLVMKLFVLLLYLGGNVGGVLCIIVCNCVNIFVYVFGG